MTFGLCVTFTDSSSCPQIYPHIFQHSVQMRFCVAKVQPKADLPWSAAHAGWWWISHSDGTCPDQCSFCWPWQGRQCVMFCFTLRGDVLEPNGCASLTIWGWMNGWPVPCPSPWTQWVRDPSWLKLHQRIGLMGGPVCTEPYYGQCHHPRKLNSILEAQDM